jgi:hypothetical protein
VPKDGHERDAHVDGCAKTDPRHDHFEDGGVYIEKEYDEPREEEE